jgi:hypothetical protein
VLWGKNYNNAAHHPTNSKKKLFIGFTKAHSLIEFTRERQSWFVQPGELPTVHCKWKYINSKNPVPDF